jgi:hypothetical protein
MGFLRWTILYNDGLYIVWINEYVQKPSPPTPHDLHICLGSCP